MGDLSQIFKLFFGSWELACLFALLAVALYVGIRFLFVHLPKLLLAIPIAVVAGVVRAYSGVTALRAQLEAGIVTPGYEADEMAKLLDAYLGWLQRRIERLMSEKHRLASILFQEDSLRSELRSIEQRSVRLLEADRSVAEVMSHDASLKERGILNLAANPQVTNHINYRELLATFLVAILSGGGAADIAKYHLKRRIQEESRTELIENWPEPTKLEVDRIVASLEGHEPSNHR